MDIEQQVEILERLAVLRERGALTENEYQIERSRLLDPDPSAYGANLHSIRRRRYLIAGTVATAAISVVATASAVFYGRPLHIATISTEATNAPSPATQSDMAGKGAAPASNDAQDGEASTPPQLATLRVRCETPGL